MTRDTRTARIEVRATTDEKLEMTRRGIEAGFQSLSDYLRYKGLGHDAPPASILGDGSAPLPYQDPSFDFEDHERRISRLEGFVNE